MRELFVNYNVKSVEGYISGKLYTSTRDTVIILDADESLSEALENFKRDNYEDKSIREIVINNIYLVETKDD